MEQEMMCQASNSKEDLVYKTVKIETKKSIHAKNILHGKKTILLSFINSKHFSYNALIVDNGGNRGIVDMPFILH